VKVIAKIIDSASEEHFSRDPDESKRYGNNKFVAILSYLCPKDKGKKRINKSSNSFLSENTIIVFYSIITLMHSFGFVLMISRLMNIKIPNHIKLRI